MKRSFLSKLHTNGIYYITGTLLLIIGVPLYQYLVLLPQGYNDVLSSAEAGAFAPYLLWIGSHFGAFLGYRALSIAAFTALLGLPFTLFRIIVAQEILGSENTELVIEVTSEEDHPQQEPSQESAEASGELQEMEGGEASSTLSWRGKGFAVLGAWTGLLAIILYLLGTLVGTFYLTAVSNSFTEHTAISGSFSTISMATTIVTYTIGGGLLSIACLFFGAMIVRSGMKLWPGIWVAFGYTALAVAALLSVSAVAIVSAPIEGKAVLTTPAILLFALWALWLGIMLVRLKPEP
ncbi:MAG: hypothetical protein NVS9B9_19770 [Ktedonobacteraceae bacterium]